MSSSSSTSTSASTTATTNGTGSSGGAGNSSSSTSSRKRSRPRENGSGDDLGLQSEQGGVSPALVSGSARGVSSPARSAATSAPYTPSPKSAASAKASRSMCTSLKRYGTSTFLLSNHNVTFLVVRFPFCCGNVVSRCLIYHLTTCTQSVCSCVV
ncbi:hypothetical protein PoB_006507800 [Plakobranchus ocellatus]|uniref:REJ domain-containing protein n=1 Tax=Plakobranchus ocellatus TaxID=259542 RepID=A0AAV4D3F8_9GAST|nr:hypothetical protein PoB_006507800 [Plakobranchus ocellatus]